MFESEFLSNAAGGLEAYRAAMLRAIDLLCASYPSQSYSGMSPAALGDLVRCEALPETGTDIDETGDRLKDVISHSVAVSHPYTAAHLHCPPLISGLAAEVVISALNQSMDSFDQAPVATVLEEKMVELLAREVGFSSGGSGTFTAGGTQSNYMGLLLARDACLERHWNWKAQTRGLPAEACRMRILCSEVAHFTVEKSAAQLGLGTDSVIRVATDSEFRMDPEALRTALDELRSQSLVPTAVVATAGTTDFGSIDPLPEIAALAREAGAWFHVDAAYGSALLFSLRYRQLLTGIERADSLSMDFHKLFWQPISCAAFLLRDARHFDSMRLHADYLNPELHEQLGIPNLVTRSLATTRRFDALKLWMSFQMLGRRRLGEMIDATIDLAAHAADFIRAHDKLELMHHPTISCVVFRYLPANSLTDSTGFNARLRQHLFENGIAVIGHTIVRGRQCLKLTCMNPTVSKQQIEELLQLVIDHGTKLEQDG